MAKARSFGAAIEAAAGKKKLTVVAPRAAETAKTTLVGAHFDPEVRRVLKRIEADTSRNLKQVLGEAINDLADKYGQPRPYDGEA